MIVRFFVTIGLFFCLTISFASHIVGGDLKVVMVNSVSAGAYYNFQLRLYRDDVNANVGVNMPLSAEIGIYDLATHTQVTTLLLPRTSVSFVPLGDACYTPDPNVVKIEEGIFTNTNALLLPNNSNGYYVQYENFARNGIISNILNPAGTGITILAMFPDPALGQNSSPDFGVYPSDAYFCVNNTKVFNFPVTDPDGDSLSFSLVTPLDVNNQTNAQGGGTSAGGGSYPFYPECNWAPAPPGSPPYSVTNIIGGSPPMTIDPVTGEISASPNIQSFFVFTVRVEEFRNGNKIGEVRRDVQYASLGCQINYPPQITLDDTVSVYVDDSVCIDLETFDTDSLVDLYVQLSSTDFDINGTYIPPYNTGNSAVMGCQYTINLADTYGDGWQSASVDILVNGVVALNATISSQQGAANSETFWVYNGDVITTSWNQGIPSGLYDYECSFVILDNNGTQIAMGTNSNNFSISPHTVSSCAGNISYYAYDNWGGISSNTNTFVELDTANGYTHGIGSVPFRFCWTPSCDDVDEIYTINVEAYSMGCSGPDYTYDNIKVEVLNSPPPTLLYVPDTMTIVYEDSICIDLLAEDTINDDDTLFLYLASGNFNFIESFVAPELNNNGNYEYHDFNNIVGNTIEMINYNYVANYSSVTSAIGEIGMRFCWSTDCDFVFKQQFDIYYAAFSTVCGSDTIFDTSSVNILPPVGQLEPVPNIFTPNNDGQNDFYELAGDHDPCYDEMHLVIYNRWGKMVFESTDSNFKWDGKNLSGNECPDGLYSVIIDGTFGSNYDSNGGRQPNVIVDQYWIQLIR